jgi:hypothetical protein
MPGEPVPVTGVWLHKNFPHLQDGKLDLYVEVEGNWRHIQEHEHPDQGVISHITEVAGIRDAPVWDPDAEKHPRGWTKGPGAPQQIRELADYLLAEWRDEIGVDNDGSAVDMAIRLLRKLKRTREAMEQYAEHGSGTVNVRQVLNLLKSDTVNEANS